jgi:hypothetical protein
MTMVRRVNGGAQANPEVQRLALLLEEAKGEVRAWEAEVERLTPMVIAAMHGRKQQVVQDGNDELVVNAMHGSTIELDQAMLKRKLGAAAWKLITSEVLDKRKLEAAMVTEQIDPGIVAACSTEKPKKSYVTVTRKKTRGGRKR